MVLSGSHLPTGAADAIWQADSDVSPARTPQQNVRLPFKAAPYFAALGAAAVPTLAGPQRLG
jgi:hypothetical protein